MLQVDNTWVTHLAEFIIESINTNIARFTTEIELSREYPFPSQLLILLDELIGFTEILVPIFNIDGHYAMDGKVMNLFPLYGAGNY